MPAGICDASYLIDLFRDVNLKRWLTFRDHASDRDDGIKLWCGDPEICNGAPYLAMMFSCEVYHVTIGILQDSLRETGL